ncbi:hypothetical protein [Pedobacter sp. Leaf132]|uniref:hypothetical protein n=1 Tax=Pedobacter sp. Leaf132 TaxID=2876557 RepID=UPI001E549228|nr:hypothetical protein [Pedobacter sp. Leaf132]
MMTKTYLKFIITATFITISGYVQSQTVAVDHYFNSETKLGADGQTQPFHYLWNDSEMTGFSILGASFKNNGAKELTVLFQKPTAKTLAQIDAYIIVDPDNLKDNSKPNYMNLEDANAIADWVKRGGVLLLLANDQANADLEHFNILAEKFGFKFNNDLILHVVDDAHFEDGAIKINNNQIFKTSKKIFIKDASSISISHTATPILKTIREEIAMVISRYGKGTVLAIGDPWLYNEYTNGRLPQSFENDKAADDLSKFMLKATKLKH